MPWISAIRMISPDKYYGKDKGPIPDVPTNKGQRHLLRKLQRAEAFLSEVEKNEPYGPDRGHEAMRKKLLDEGRKAHAFFVKSQLYSMIYKRFSIRNAGRGKIEFMNREKLSSYLVGKDATVGMTVQDTKKILLEQWYTGESPTLEMYQKKQRMLDANYALRKAKRETAEQKLEQLKQPSTLVVGEDDDNNDGWVP
jgi:hypothetical protein